MSNRDAVDTIKGYFYQFDYSILRLLLLSNKDDTIIVEGMEDLDVKTTDEFYAVQCKYYEKTTYNHSVIGEPIRLMLSHYKEVIDDLKPRVQYYLYGHYNKGQHKLQLPLTKDFLKQHFLTYTKNKVKHYHHTELGLDDNDLEDFIDKLTINIEAVSYEKQYERIISAFEDKFNCSRFEAEYFYYNNALKVIKDLSTKSSELDREISQKEFFNQIDNKQLLFNEWFVALKGKEQFLRYLKKEYFSKLNVSPFERFFLIEVNKYNYSRPDLKELLVLISKHWSNLSKRATSPFCPYVYIHNISDEELVEIKGDLFQEGFKFIDGFSFYGASFSPEAICEPASQANQVTLKIINKLEHLNLILDRVRKTKEIYQFYIHKPFYENNSQSIKHISIQVEEINDIKEII